MVPFCLRQRQGKTQGGTRFSSASSEFAPRLYSQPWCVQGPHLQDAHSILDPVPGLTLDPQALLVLDDEVLLGLLQLLQLVLRVLGDQAQLLKRLVDLKVLLGHGISKTSSWRASLGTDGEIQGGRVS